MDDPVLRVYRQGAPVPIFQNDNWESVSYAEEVAATSDGTGAFALAAGSNDAVLLLTLPPGLYTAVVTGASDTSGVALVEVYEVQ
jgi:hypothetical protein